MIRATGDQTGCVMDRYLILALLVVGCLSAPHGVIGQDGKSRPCLAWWFGLIRLALVHQHTTTSNKLNTLSVSSRT